MTLRQREDLTEHELRILDAHAEAFDAVITNAKYTYPWLEALHLGLEALKGGSEIVWGRGYPKRPMRVMCRELAKRGVPVLSAAQNQWVWFWVEIDALEARHTADPQRMRELAAMHNPDEGYLPYTSAKHLYGEYHIVRDAIGANPNTPSELLVEMLVHAKKAKVEGPIAEELERRSVAGDALAGLGLRYVIETDVSAKSAAQVLETVYSVCGDD